MTTTAENITTAQIKALRDKASAAGEFRMNHTCGIALARMERDNESGEPLTDYDGQPTTRSEARAECAQAIADAEAQG